MRKFLNFNRNKNNSRAWTHFAAAVSIFGCVAGIGALPACSNSLKVSSQAGPTSVVPMAPSGSIDFRPLGLEGISLDSDVLALSYTEKNKGLIVLGNKSAIGLDLDQEAGAPTIFTPSLQPADSDAKVYPFGRNDYWALTPTKVAHVVEKSDGGEVVSRADVNFGGEPQVLAVSKTVILVRVGQVYKVLRNQGRFEFIYDGALDYKGRTAPLSKVIGAGLVGESGFWISDGERVVSFIVRAPNQAPEIIAQKFKTAGLGDASLVALLVAEKDGKLLLQGSGLAYRAAGKVFLRTGNLDGATATSDVISDPAVADLIKNNCVGCHGDNAANGFKGALKVSAWTASANKIKGFLEANTMPPGGTVLETRQRLAQFLKSVSGVEATIAAPTAVPTTVATPDLTKVNEFNNTYRAIIRTNCVNSCHDHVFDEANDVTFDDVKRNAVGMKGRLDSTGPNRMPRAPVNIPAAVRTNLSNWLGTLNP